MMGILMLIQRRMQNGCAEFQASLNFLSEKISYGSGGCRALPWRESALGNLLRAEFGLENLLQGEFP